MIRSDAAELYLLGDVFDFWFEYKHAVPRGYTRLLGTLALMNDEGIKINYFTGNHDMWVFDYIPKETGATLYRETVMREYWNKKFFIGHGDGLGPGDHGYKFIKKVFAGRFSQWLFARIHPNFGTWLANYFSRKSRIATGTTDKVYLGDDKEYLMLFCIDYLQTHHVDYFIFGHRHLVIDKKVGTNSRYINLGDWVTGSNYAVFDGEKLEVKRFEG